MKIKSNSNRHLLMNFILLLVLIQQRNSVETKELNFSVNFKNYLRCKNNVQSPCVPLNPTVNSVSYPQTGLSIVTKTNQNQPFTFTAGQSAFRFSLPTEIGRVDVKISQFCESPVVVITSNQNPLFTVTNDSLSFTGKDLVNYFQNVTSLNLNFTKTSNTYLSNFTFNRDQYFLPALDSFLHIFCPYFDQDASSKVVSVDLQVYSSALSQQFVYFNPNAVTDLDTSVLLKSNSQFLIRVSSLPKKIFWVIQATDKTDFSLTVNGGSEVKVPSGSKASIELQGDSLFEILLKGGNTNDSNVSIKTSLKKKLETYQIVLISVFSAVGGLLILGGVLFLIVYCIRKRSVKYPKIDNVPNELQGSANIFKPENQTLFIYPTSTDASDFTAGAILGNPNIDFPQLEQGNETGQKDAIIMARSEMVQAPR